MLLRWQSLTSDNVLVRKLDICNVELRDGDEDIGRYGDDEVEVDYREVATLLLLVLEYQCDEQEG